MRWLPELVISDSIFAGSGNLVNRKFGLLDRIGLPSSTAAL